MATVFANSRSITHKGDGQTNVAAPPDVCKTPSPGGPVPIPYVNIAKTSDLASGSKKTKIEGNPAALESSNLSTSTGDEAGTAGGGIMSSKTKGKLTWATSSPTVQIEGKKVVRFMDVAQHNGNSFNTAFTEMGGTGLAYGDDFTVDCDICGEPPEKHRVLETTDSAGLCADLVKALRAKPAAEVGKPNYGEEGIDGYRGYMVGVMVCKCGQIFAAMSGKSTLEGFADVVKAGPWTLVSGGTVTKTEYMDANCTSKPDFTGKEGAARAAEARRSGGVRRNIDKKLKAINKTNPSPKLGECAGARLVARSPAADHVPKEMTEMYYSPPGDTWSQSYEVLVKVANPEDSLEKQRSNEGAARESRSFSEASENPDKDDSVASCTTCQQALPLSLCHTEDSSC